MEDILQQALNNELTEAKIIVDQKIEENDKICFYKMYTIGKILMKYLEQRMNEGDKFAKNVNEHLQKMANYYDDRNKD